MEIFVNEPELLEGTQTFIGVLITLLVLCLFHDEKTNFMLRIVGSMIDDFLSSIAHSVDRMRSDLKKPKTRNKSEELAYADNYWIKQSEAFPDIHDEFLTIYEESEDIINKYVNKYQKHLTRLKQIQQKVNEKSENELISHSLMLYLMVVMTLDGIGVSADFGCFFLSFLMVLTIPYFCYIWYQYIRFKDAPPVVYRTRKTRTLLFLTCLTVFLSFFAWLGITTFMRMPTCSYVFCSMVLFMIPMFVVGLSISANFKKSERYNKKFVTNHTIYILFTSLLLSLCVYGICRAGLPFGLSNNSCYVANWNANIEIVTNNISIIRNALVLFAVLNAFFIPMFAVFIYYQTNSICIKVMMINQKHNARNELKKKRNKMIELEHNITHKVQEVSK